MTIKLGVLANASGLHSARPAANTAGAGYVYFSTDIDQYTISDGTNWLGMDQENFSPIPHSSIYEIGAVAKGSQAPLALSNLSLSGNLTVGGTAIVTGAMTLSSTTHTVDTITSDGDLNIAGKIRSTNTTTTAAVFDTNTLIVDASIHRVIIGDPPGASAAGGVDIRRTGKTAIGYVASAANDEILRIQNLKTRAVGDEVSLAFLDLANFKAAVTCASGSTSTSLAAFAIKTGNGVGTGVMSDLVTRLLIAPLKTLTDGSPINILSCTIASGTAIGGVIHYVIEVTDGTDVQTETGYVFYSAVNKGGVVTRTITESADSQQAVSAGTLATTWAISAASPAVVSINADSSLTPSAGYPRITFEVFNGGQQAIALV